MKTLLLCAGVLLGNMILVGQSPASPSAQVQPPLPGCAKTISFAVAEGGQPVPAIPTFAGKWIGKKYHVEGHPELCLSQIPSSTTANYVVIFSTSDASFEGLMPSAHTYTSTGPQSSNVAGVTSYGGTWNYSYSSTLPAATTSSIDLLKVDASKKMVLIRVYNQQGHQLSRYSVDADHNRENRLQQAIEDIHRDVVEKPSQTRIAAPLSVYYVNCDVDSPGPTSLVASADPPPAALDAKPVASPPPPQATLELVSNPAGADIYVDDKYMGKTPLTASVAPGEHVVILRKADFSIWDRKLQLASGPRHINAYLERKFLTLSSSQPQTIQQPVQSHSTQPQTGISTQH
jgi:PEGA domain-containing protein